MSAAFVTARALLAAATLPLLTGYALVAAVFVAITASASHEHFSATDVLLAAGPGWLSVYQVPVFIDGHELSVLPLAATIGVCVLVARSAQGTAQRLDGDRSHALTVCAVIACAHGLAGVTFALFAQSGRVVVDPLAACLVPALLAGLAASLGLARHAGLHTFVRAYIDEPAVAGLRAGLLGIAGLVATGALVLTLSAVLSVDVMRGLFEGNAPGFGSGFGMLLLSIGYLPNAVLSGLAFATGPGFSFGEVAANPFDFTGGVVPGVPLLAAVPDAYANWWVALLALPAAVGVLIGWQLRRSDPLPIVRLRSTAIAGVCAGLGCLVLMSVASGELGQGPFGSVTVPAGLVSIAAFGWIAVPGGVIAWFAGPRPPTIGSAQEDHALAEVESESGSAMEIEDEVDIAGDSEVGTGEDVHADSLDGAEQRESQSADVEPGEDVDGGDARDRQPGEQAEADHRAESN